MTRTEVNFSLINRVITQNIETFLDYFELTYSKFPNRISLACPLHDSSRNNSLCIFAGEKDNGNYVCWTRHCESIYGHWPINFIYGLMKKKSESTKFFEAIKFVSEITGGDFSVPVNLDREMSLFNYINREPKERENKVLCSKDHVRKTLRMPCEYFINRGFSKETLDYFDVGLSCIKVNDMYMRAVVPVYDISGFNMIGCLGRSINEECPICELYHDRNIQCPSDGIDIKRAMKWINNKNFVSGSALYNIHNASKFSKETDNITIVEGAGDVWKMHQAGYKDCVSIFGCNFTDVHFSIIESLGITNITLLLDNDLAGKTAQQKIVKRLSDYYNIKQPNLGKYKDIGSTPIEIIKEIIE